MAMTRAYKTISFKTEEFDDEKGIFRGYAAVFGNIDTGGDIIEPGAFEKTLEENIDRIKILALHNDQWLPIGKPLKLKEVEKGLYIEGKISDTSMGKDVKVLLRDEVLTEMSIGYDPVVGGFDYDDDGIRHLREVDLWEVSIVTWAMNPAAVITDYKAAASMADRVSAMTREVAAAQKSGRKISQSRLKNLVAARDAMKSATKVLDSVIREARDGEKSQPARASLSAPPRGASKKQIIITGGR